jgi:choline dehydrogenase
MMDDASNQNATQYLVSGLDATVVAGYDSQKAILVNLLRRTNVSVCEILNDNVGLLAVAAMHPFSRGSIHIQSILATVPILWIARFWLKAFSSITNSSTRRR